VDVPMGFFSKIRLVSLLAESVVVGGKDALAACFLKRNTKPADSTKEVDKTCLPSLWWPLFILARGFLDRTFQSPFCFLGRPFSDRLGWQGLASRFICCFWLYGPASHWSIPLQSSEVERDRAFAIFTTFRIPGFRKPLSIPLIYVGSRPANSASFSCVSSLDSRCRRIFEPNADRTGLRCCMTDSPCNERENVYGL